MAARTPQSTATPARSPEALAHLRDQQRRKQARARLLKLRIAMVGRIDALAETHGVPRAVVNELAERIGEMLAAAAHHATAYQPRGLRHS